MRILVVVLGGVGPRVTGPEIRGWELAKALSQRHDVTVIAREPPAAEREGIPLVALSRPALARQARAHDAVIAPVLAPYLFATLRGAQTLTVSDQYDPVELELAALTDQPDLERVLRCRHSARRLQLRFADVIVCAGESQRARALADLASIADRPVPPRVVSVPFGIAEPPPPPRPGALRERFDAIGPTDPVVLWWGKPWRWFDASTAIEAFELVVRRRPEARLVISAGKAPQRAFDRSEATAEARATAERLGLLGRNVFFLEDWVPYERRHELLTDADLGLTLHAATSEAPFAARARYMDYLWCALPPVLTGGDEVADRFGETGFAALVPPGDREAAADAILSALADRRSLQEARGSGRRLANHYRWTRLVEPLAEAIEAEAANPNRPRSRAHVVARDVGAYYARRAVDRVVAAAGAS